MRLCTGLLSFALLASSLSAQPFTEKIDVSLVNVDVTVTSHGSAVRGLTRDDFEVLEDGVLQPITNFYAIGTPAPALSRVEGSTPPSSDDERFRRHILLLIDNTHLTKFSRNRALDGIEKFINDRFTGGAYDWSIAVVDSTVHVALAQTSDKALIHNALDQIRRGAAREVTWSDTTTLACPENLGATTGAAALVPVDDAAQTICDLAGQVGARQQMMSNQYVQRSIFQAVRGFAGTPGKKVLLVLTNDLGLNNVASSTPAGAALARELVKLRDAIIREANASNVSLYIMNGAGLTPGGDITSHAAPTDVTVSAIGAPPTDMANMYWVARETGGRLMPGNSPEVSIRQFDDASSRFYSLAYRASHSDDGRYHRIQVRVKRPGRYELRYRDGYAAIPRELEIVRALQTPLSAVLQSSTLSVSATAGDVRRLGKGIEVPIEARIPLKDLQFTPAGNGWHATVDVFVSIFDEDGTNLALRRFTTTANAPDAAAEGELVHNATVRLGSGKAHTIVIAVRDQASDAVGLWRQSVHF
jgi:VWFA-related protein